MATRRCDRCFAALSHGMSVLMRPAESSCHGCSGASGCCCFCCDYSFCGASACLSLLVSTSCLRAAYSYIINAVIAVEGLIVVYVYSAKPEFVLLCLCYAMRRSVMQF